MSLFNAFMGGDMDDDPIFGFHSRAMNQMNAMMNSVMMEGFGDMMGGLGGMGGFPGGFPSLMGAPMMGPMVGHGQLGQMNQMMPHQPHHRRSTGGMIPSPFDMFGGMHGNGGLSFSSSSMTSMTLGPDGRPQVYQATSSTRSAPGGIKETKKTVSDSRSGVKKMAIGHHIGERAHIIEKKQNVHTGQREENVELVNLSDDETEEFNHEWESATRGGHLRSSNPHPRRIAHYGGVTIEDVTEDNGQAQLALPAPSPSTSTSHSSQRVRHPKKSPTSPTTSTSHDRPKKRDHGAGGPARAAKQHRSRQNY